MGDERMRAGAVCVLVHSTESQRMRNNEMKRQRRECEVTAEK
jgi:hypothetical protein